MTNHTTYTFKKNGHSYSVKATNPYDAQVTAELMFHINLTGATCEEYYKLRLVRTWIVK